MERSSPSGVLNINCRSVVDHQFDHVVPFRTNGVHERRHAPSVTDVWVGTSIQENPGTFDAPLLAAEVQGTPEERLPQGIESVEDCVRIDTVT